MLTIQNIHKAWRRDVGDWRIGKIETTNTAYLFQLYKFNRRERIQINLERTAIGQDDTALYELWYWEHMITPQRLLLPKSAIRDIPYFLTKMYSLLYKVATP